MTLALAMIVITLITEALDIARLLRIGGEDLDMRRNHFFSAVGTA